MDLLKDLISKKKKEIKLKKFTSLKEEEEKKKNRIKRKEEEELRKIALEKREMSHQAINKIKEDVQIKASEFKVNDPFILHISNKLII
jgi:hypothetical protein